MNFLKILFPILIASVIGVIVALRSHSTVEPMVLDQTEFSSSLPGDLKSPPQENQTAHLHYVQREGETKQDIQLHPKQESQFDAHSRQLHEIKKESQLKMRQELLSVGFSQSVADSFADYEASQQFIGNPQMRGSFDQSISRLRTQSSLAFKEICSLAKPLQQRNPLLAAAALNIVQTLSVSNEDKMKFYQDFAEQKVTLGSKGEISNASLNVILSAVMFRKMQPSAAQSTQFVDAVLKSNRADAAVSKALSVELYSLFPK